MAPNIHDQLVGKAAQVLDLLGINDAALHRHIRCPLPAHADLHPSFRVDEQANCYYCSCTQRGGSLVDLVMAMQKAGSFWDAVCYLRDELRLHDPAPAHRPPMNLPAPASIASLPTPAVVTAPQSSVATNLQFASNAFDDYLKRCTAVHQHPYCHAKKIPPIGAYHDRVMGHLVLPLHDVNGVTTGIQLISPSGRKWFVEGSRMRGNGLLLGTIERDSLLGITEGWATGVTIFSLLNQPVLVTFSANNLLAAARPYQRPWLPMVIFGDLDASGVGQRYALEAAEALGARAIFPPTRDLDCDFNDLYVRKLRSNVSSVQESRHA